MAGAVAFVFGLCALSFAVGCVVTAVMLRGEEAVPEVVPAPVVVWPPEGGGERPVHRNPVVGVEFEGPLASVIELVPVPEVVGVVGPEFEFEPVELPDFEEPGFEEAEVRVVVSLPEQPVRMLAHNEEFRQRYLRTFEAARRRASR
ncbi:hypothetical protein [Umezawaea tangerina]|uniref:Uncharacterized protein n=1 Tax=Umezawaea tangerina TaxID=84725 RepID=A0A2T0TAY8_9PSEU|nr:hypothetical protein [Umezawaea tangerina]PRY42826.1 hypothetical protein CLV43_104663 [Umezawaea tangerina]